MRDQIKLGVMWALLMGVTLAVSAMQQQGPATPAAPAPAGPASAGGPAGPARGRGRGPAIPPPSVAPVGKPLGVIDLMTPEGVSLVGAKWKIMDAKIVEAPALFTQGPMALLPQYKTTYDITPHADVANFDDSSWPTIEPKELGIHRGGGRIAFVWYRITLTLPEMVGTVAVMNRTAVLVANVDDYAEVLINGQMPRAVGLPSPATIQGFNMPQRVKLSEMRVNPGDKFEVAILGINGPIAIAPTNGLFVRDARIELF